MPLCVVSTRHHNYLFTLYQLLSVMVKHPILRWHFVWRDNYVCCRFKNFIVGDVYCPYIRQSVTSHCDFTGELFFITDRGSGFWNIYKWVMFSLSSIYFVTLLVTLFFCLLFSYSHACSVALSCLFS